MFYGFFLWYGKYTFTFSNEIICSERGNLHGIEKMYILRKRIKRYDSNCYVGKNSTEMRFPFELFLYEYLEWNSFQIYRLLQKPGTLLIYSEYFGFAINIIVYNRENCLQFTAITKHYGIGDVISKIFLHRPYLVQLLFKCRSYAIQQ